MKTNLIKAVFLLLAGFPVFCRGQVYSLEFFVCSGNLDGVKQVVEQDGADVNSVFALRRTPLQEAAWDGDLEIAQYLIDHGASINSKDAAGVSPLMDAVWGDHPEIAKLLISKGADVNIQIPGQTNLYRLAVWKNETEIVQILKSMHVQENPTYP